MKKFACQYALLRFRPFVETGEFANVGIVLMAPEARFFGFRLLKRYGRITQFFHELDRKVYLDGRDLFKEELERFAGDLRHLALDGRKTQPDLALARNLFNELVRPREAMLQFADQRVVLTDEPKVKLGETLRPLRRTQLCDQGISGALAGKHRPQDAFPRSGWRRISP